MCVIIMIEKTHPHPRFLEQAWEENGDGVGLAWREPATDGNGTEVVWKKGFMDKAEALEAIANIPLPAVVHFRKTSIGGTRQAFCHPFEISETTQLDLEGRTKNAVLFHNGTWTEWADKTLIASIHANVPLPVGKWMDSRAIAWLCALYGEGFMDLLTIQRGVAFGPDHYNIFVGPGWVPVKDQNGTTFWCSKDDSWRPKYNQGHVMCTETSCYRRDVVGNTGKCSIHVPLSPDQKALPAAGGTPIPFQPPGNITIKALTLEEADRLYKEGRINKGMWKGLQDLSWRIKQDGKSSKATRKAAAARNSLMEISAAMRWTGFGV